jgi:hypothetical protein
MTKVDVHEALLAEVLSQYVDRLNEGAAPHVDEFLKQHAAVASELRPLLETALALAEGTAPAPVPPEASRAAFERVCSRLAGSERQQDGRTSQPGSGAMQLETRTDFLLLLLHIAGKMWGITRVVKLLFLMGKEGRCDKWVPDYYAHVAYDYGPFDDAVYQDVEALKRLQLVSASKPPRRRGAADGDVAVGLSERKVDAIYSLTPLGEKLAGELAAKAWAHSPEAVEGVEEIAQRFGRMPLKDLLKYVYERYPDYTEKSKIRDEVLGTDDE